MALARVKTWSSGEVLTASDLNAEFNNLLNNATSLISPLTAVLDMNGFELVMDADADSSLTADTDDRLDVRLGAVDLFVFNGTTASCVNGLTFFGTATGANAYIQANGSDSNTAITLKDANGNELLITASVASAVNEVTLTAAATGIRPRIAASGETNVGLALRPKGTGAGASVVLEDGSGNEVLICGVATASAVNEVTITNAATGNPAIIAASGETNVSLDVRPKGSGTVRFTDGTDVTKKVSLALSGITTSTTRTLTMPDADVTLLQGAATQAQMETGTSLVVSVTPGRQHNHPGHPKFFLYADSAGNMAASYNMTSISDVGTGVLDITIATDFSSANWTCLVCTSTSDGALRLASVNTTTPQAAGTARFNCISAAATLADPANWNILGMGDQ